MVPSAPLQLVVSTHYDDAVLSLAHVLQRAGERALVVTVCGGAPPGERPASDWDRSSGFAGGRDAATMRRLEDERACAVTGARRASLRHLDAPYRARSLSARAVRASIRRLLSEGDMLWLPAGIGEHPDHVDVRAALLPLAALLPPSRVGIYADLPYAGRNGYRLPQEVRDALPGLRGRDVRLSGTAFERKLAAVRCHASQITPLGEGAPDLLTPGGVLARERTWTA